MGDTSTPPAVPAGINPWHFIVSVVKWIFAIVVLVIIVAIVVFGVRYAYLWVTGDPRVISAVGSSTMTYKEWEDHFLAGHPVPAAAPAVVPPAAAVAPAAAPVVKGSPLVDPATKALVECRKANSCTEAQKVAIAALAPGVVGGGYISEAPKNPAECEARGGQDTIKGCIDYH